MINILKNKVRAIRRRAKYHKFYKQFISSGDICFDIGANLGSRTQTFSELGATVIAVEPVEETYTILKNNFLGNKNITCIKAAVGSQSDLRKIHISNHHQISTLSEMFIEKYKAQEIYWHSTEEVEVITLDTLINKYGIPAFCKIDVEGYEKEVLTGLSQALPFLSFEYNARLKMEAISCLDILSEHESNRYNFSAYESMNFEFSEWLSLPQFQRFISKLPEEVETGDIYVKNTL